MKQPRTEQANLKQSMRSIPSHVVVWYGLVTMAIVGFALPSPTQAQADPFEPSFAGEIMNGLSKGMEAAAGYAAFKADFNIKIAAAREEYWSAYPDGPGVDEARAKYMEMLAAKDIVNILPSLVSGPTYGLKWAKGIDVLSSPDIYSSPDDEEAVARLDGGVHPLAEPALKAMARAIRESAGLTPDPPSRPPLEDLLIIPSPTAAKAIAANQKALDAYIVARNQAEMLVGLQYMHFASDRAYLAQRLMLERAFESVEDAEQYFKEIDEVLGPGRVDESAAGIRRLPVDEHGQLIHPEQLGPYSPENSWTKTVSAKALLDIHVGHADARGYALAMIRFDMHVGWPEALELYKTYWVEPFGEKTVLSAAEQVRLAPKRPSSGSGYLAEEIRYTRRPPEAMRRLMPHDPYRDYPLASLTDDDPKQYLYAVLRHFGTVQYWNEVPEAYDKLVQRWGDTRLTEALAKLMSARKKDDGTLAAPEDLSVSSGDPARALEELLQQEAASPRSYFADLFTTEAYDGAREYDALANCFGAQQLDDVVNRVRKAQEQRLDLATLEGAVSGFHEPTQAILDILWATSSPESYHHYMIWRWKASHYANRANKEDLTAVEARVREEIVRQLERFGQDNVYAAAEKIAAAPKQPFTLYYYYFGTAPRLVDPKAINPELIERAGEIDQLVDFVYVSRLANILSRPEPVTAFKVGDEFEIEFRGAWRKTKVLRVQPLVGGGANCLIQVDVPGQAPFSRLESWLKKNSRAVQGYAGSSTAGQRNGPAPEEQTPQPAPADKKITGGEFPVGATVQFTPPYTAGRPLVRGIVKDYDPRRGWLVEYQRQSRTSRQWCNSFYVEHSGMTRVADASAAAQAGPVDKPDPAAAPEPRQAKPEAEDFPVGSAVQLVYGGDTCRGIVQNYNSRSGWLVEFQRRGRAYHTWIRPNAIQRFQMRLVPQ